MLTSAATRARDNIVCSHRCSNGGGRRLQLTARHHPPIVSSGKCATNPTWHHVISDFIRFVVPGLVIGSLGWLRQRRAKEDAEISSVLQRRDP